MSKLSELRKARQKVGNDIDAKQRERDQARQERHAKEHQRDKLKKKLKDKRDRDPQSEQRIKELEREIEKHAENLKKLNDKTIPALLKDEKLLTDRIDELQKREEKIEDKIAREKREKDEGDKIVIQSGPEHWGGCADIIQQEVDPVAARFGVPETSHKRAANDPLTQANPDSDHSVLAVNAYATDYGTFNGAPVAYEMAKELGISGYSIGSYTGHYIQRAGRTFRVQILWAVSGHYNHVHTGLRLV